MWIQDWSRSPDVDLRVLCLPPAGGGARAFRGWARRLPPRFGVAAVELPGHGARLREAPCSDAAEVIGALREECVRSLLDAPLVVFGHSLGALLGWALCGALQEHDPAWRPALFVAAASEAPGRVRLPAGVASLSDAAVVEYLRRGGGTDEALLADAEYRALLVPAIRADLMLAASVTAMDSGDGDGADAYRLRCAVRAYTATGDAAVDREGVQAWRARAAGGGDADAEADFAVREFDGDHFFVQRAEGEVLGRLQEDVAACTGLWPAPASAPTWKVLG